MKKRTPNLVDSLVPVNRNAGRLRSILAILLTFILWTLIAQSHPERTPILFQQKDNAGFTESIVGEMLVRYFSPQTILLTSIPLFLFLAAKNHVISFISHLFPEMEWIKQYHLFLNECAFSRQKKRLTINRNTLSNNKDSICFSKQFGAKDVLVSNAYMLILENLDTLTYTIIHSDDATATLRFPLQYRQRVFTIIQKKQLSFSDDCTIPALDQVHLFENRKFTIDLKLRPSVPQEENYFSQDISKEDAKFLRLLECNNNIVRTYITHEIEKYFRENFKPKENLNSVNNSEGNPDPLADTGKQHKQYKISLHNQAQRRSFRRPHRRSLYNVESDTRMHANQDDLHQESTDTSSTLLNLNQYIQGQVVSFFNIEDIQITIKKGK